MLQGYIYYNLNYSHYFLLFYSQLMKTFDFLRLIIHLHFLSSLISNHSISKDSSYAFILTA
jgi:hypothetical protein